MRALTKAAVVISLAILGISLGVLLTSQASSLDNAARARDLTIATLLARSKMIDIEQKLFDEGFVEGDQTEEGDFEDEGHKEITWEASISEVEMDLSGIMDMCSGFDTDGGGTGESDCSSMLGGLGGMLDGFVSEIGKSIRLVELTVTWPTGGKYTESMGVKTIVTREDLGMQAAAGTSGVNLDTGGGGQPP